jgi:hypothetical protein
MGRARERIVRLLEQAVDVAFGTASSNGSGLEPDKSERKARRNLAVLKELASRDPDDEFDTHFVRLQLMIFRRMRRRSH